MVQEQTPEEKLLNIIRKKDTMSQESLEQKVPESVLPEEAEIVPVKESELPEEKEPLDYEKSFWDEKVPKRFFRREIKNLKMEKMDFLIFLILLVSMFVMNWFMGATARGQVMNQKVKDSSIEIPSLNDQNESYSQTYRKLFNKKGIFAEPPKKPTRTKPQKNIKTLSDIIKDLKLLGILQDPWQAIVQSRKGGGTRYLKKGDIIDGAEIESIEKGRVILHYQGETAELSM